MLGCMRQRSPLIPGLVAVAVLAGAGWWAFDRTERSLVAEKRAAGEARVALYNELLRGWLGKYRALPSIYAHEPDMLALLGDAESAGRLAAVNEKLERWNATSGAAATYLLDRAGVTIAASNWNRNAGAIGAAYPFRPYFRQAMQGRLGRTFAMGTVSGRRGYYFAYPVQEETGRIVGAVVVKAGVDGIEQELRLDTGAVFVTDRDGVIVLAGPPHWRMKTLGDPTPEALDRIGEEQRFPVATLRPLAVEGLATGAERVRANPDRSGTRQAEFLHLSQEMTTENWRVHLLVETDGIRRQGLIVALLTVLTLLTGFLAGLLLWQRRRRMMALLDQRERSRLELEGLVSERTANLREANRHLEREVRERTQAEDDLRRTQGELVQAGKLAALGQMSAALSHEFNQPLAAIRTYSDNAVAFLDRGRAEQAGENLARISRLTERMARLSKHLTSFARKPRDTTEPVALDAVIAETRALLHARIERAGARIDDRLPPGIAIMGGQTRLQHVFMNLIGNALDATGDRPDPLVILRAEEGDGGTVRVIVEDNGPGIDAGMIADIFDPFFSTKEPGKGLGLGLSISFNIVRDFGGHLEVENRGGGGARFVVTLRRAGAMREAAA